MNRAIVRQSTIESGVVTVRIPNSLLQSALTIKAYVGLYDGDSFKIVETIEIPVIAKEKPADYVIEDSDEVYSFNALERLVHITVDELNQTLTDQLENGAVKSLRETNKNAPFRFWVGTQAEYDALDQEQKNSVNCYYLITDENDDVLSRFIAIEEKLNVDYIVEQGESNGWTYRKWNSGMAECWRIAETTATITNKYGDAHYFDGDVNDANANINKKIAFLSIDYPFEFKTRPIVQAQLMFTEKHQVDIRVGQYTDSLTKTPHYHLCAPFPIEKELTYRISYYVIGKWK
jgi:hypothetical protein